MVIACVLIGGTASALAQDLANGENSFKKCLPCHAVGADAKNKVGPLLNGLDGRKSGSIEGYNYTEANKNSSITWDDKTFADTSPIRVPRSRAPRWYSPASRMRKSAVICGPTWKQFDAKGEKK